MTSGATTTRNMMKIKVPSQEFSDVMTEAFKNRLKEI